MPELTADDLRGPLRTSNAGHIDVYTPTVTGEDEFQETIPAEDVLPIELSERWSKRKDSGTVRLRDDTASYADAVTSGDRLDYWVEFDLPTVDTWGGGTWGDDSYYGGMRLAWTAWVRDVDVEWMGPDRADLVLDCEDFVFGVLSKRIVEQTADDDRVVKTIFDTADAAARDEITVTAPLQADETTTGAWQGRKGLDTLNDLLERGGYVATARQTQLVVSDLLDTDPAIVIDPEDVGPVAVGANDSAVVNDVRVEGGTGKTVDDSHTPDRVGWRRISPVADEGDPYLDFEIRASKAEIDRIDLWTAPTDTGSITVRVQEPDENGNIRPDDAQFDIAKRELNHRFIANDGWTAFDLPRNDDLASPRPHVIVEAEDAIQRIGIGPAAAILYQVYHPYDIVAVDTDPDSITEYRRRQERIATDAIDSFDAAVDVANEKLGRRPRPAREAHTYANRVALHLARVGTPVAFSQAFEPHVDSDATWLLTERDIEYTGDVVETDLVFENMDDLGVADDTA